MIPLDLGFSYDGSVQLLPEGLLLPLVQAPPVPEPPPHSYVEKLKQDFLQWSLGGTLGAVSDTGYVLLHHQDLPLLPPDCSPPTCVVEPSLPKGDEGESLGWQEKWISPDLLQGMAASGISRQAAAREAGRDSSWRGISATLPFTSTGAGAALVGVPTDLSPAAKEAESGLWLEQLRSAGPLPRVCPPGLSAGAFGSWRVGDDALGEIEAHQSELKLGLAQKHAALAAAAAAKAAAAGPDTAPPATTTATTIATTALDTHAATAPATLPSPGLAPAPRMGAKAIAHTESQAAKGVFEDMWMVAGEDEVAEEDKEEMEAEAPPESKTTEEAAPVNAKEEPSLAQPPDADSVDGLLASTSRMATTRAQQATGKAHPAAGAAPSAEKQHEWAVRQTLGGPAGVESAFSELKPNLALHFPFELDTFQKEAVVHLERHNSVFVAAHTSAGKTVVAEYAFALATKYSTRAIYTSPIKTISNQKFRDFSSKFDVGLLTGDVQINPTAPCLICTTEILRSMLYKGADIIRDVEWVVFDEVHYVNDVDRGVVWEEVIIMLPPHISMVLLSATLPNVMDFADWVGRIKRKVVHVTGTTKRPVPLQHSLYYAGELYTICTKDNKFAPEGVRNATLAWKKKNEVPETPKEVKQARPTGRGTPMGGPNAAGRGGGGVRGGGYGGGRGGSADKARQQVQAMSRGAGPNTGGAGGARGGERQGLIEMVQLLSKRNLTPVAVFCFSKKRCDSIAHSLGSMDLTTSEEKHTIHVFLEKCLSRLKEADRKLPQILQLRDLLRRGLGVHHAGLLPIMKEVVEMLACQGFVKVLFCTETFAMGVNAPTRTVVFHSLRKHDGKNFRYLLPGEYTQMAGRAGRRGLDTVGNVIVAAWDDIPGESDLRNILTGKGVSLESQFRLTYSMILNLMRTEDLKVEDMMKRSFSEWRAQRAAPAATAQLQAVDEGLARLARTPWPATYLGCTREEVLEYFELNEQVHELNREVQASIMTSRAAQTALGSGRTLIYSNPINGLPELAVLLGDTPASCLTPQASSTAGAGAASVLPRGTGSGPGAANGERRLALLVLHQPGGVDDRHLRTVQQLAAAMPQRGPKPQATSLPDEFAGMVAIPKGGAGGGFEGMRNTKRGGGPGMLPRYGDAGGLPYMLADASLLDIEGIGRNKIKVDAEDILSGEWGAGPEGQPDAQAQAALVAALRALQKTKDQYPEGLPLPDPRADLKVSDLNTATALTERSSLITLRSQTKAAADPSISEAYALIRGERALLAQRRELVHKLSDAGLQALPEFHKRVAVLQQMGYLDAEQNVQMKGRVACEINSTQDELLATELVFSGVLKDLSPAEAVALISALVFQEKSDVEPELPEKLSNAWKQLTKIALDTANTQAEKGLSIDPSEYIREVLHPGIMQVVYEWAQGTPFADICSLTDVMEGSIVRAVVRLDQACRELLDAGRVMGNMPLIRQMHEASAAIKRDVVFAASLYVA